MKGKDPQDAVLLHLSGAHLNFLSDHLFASKAFLN